MIRLTKEQYAKIKKNIESKSKPPIRPNPIHKNDKNAGLEQTYNAAVQALRDIKLSIGTTLFGTNDFILRIRGKTSYFNHENFKFKNFDNSFFLRNGNFFSL